MCWASSLSWLVKPDSLGMSMLLFVESMLWSIISESDFVVSSVVPSAQALLSFHMPTGKLGSRPTPHGMPVSCRISAACFLDEERQALAPLIIQSFLFAVLRHEYLPACSVRWLSDQHSPCQ